MNREARICLDTNNAIIVVFMSVMRIEIGI